MTLISKEQALQRWDSLPDNLRDALCSETNSDFIWKTCGDEHIPDEKIYSVARIAGYVLMGFVHPDDASKEIQDATGIDSRIADPIASAVNARIFTPLRQSIDDIYEPATKGWFEPKMIGAGGAPTMVIKEIQKTETQIPKPVILQESGLSDLNKKTSGFHVEISDDKLKGLSNAPRFAPVKLAVLELGKTEEKTPPEKFGSFSSLPKISKEKSGGLTPPLPEKNRTVTEIIFSPPKLSEVKLGGQAIPTPVKIQNEQIMPKMPLPGISSPVKPSVAPMPTPIQIPIEKFIGQTKTTSSVPAPFIQPIKTPPFPPAPSVKIPQPASVKSSGGVLSPSPIKPAVIRKDYSEEDLIPKIPNAPAPSPKIPIQPQKNDM